MLTSTWRSVTSVSRITGAIKRSIGISAKCIRIAVMGVCCTLVDVWRRWRKIISQWWKHFKYLLSVILWLNNSTVMYRIWVSEDEIGLSFHRERIINFNTCTCVQMLLKMKVLNIILDSKTSKHAKVGTSIGGDSWRNEYVIIQCDHHFLSTIVDFRFTWKLSRMISKAVVWC